MSEFSLITSMKESTIGPIHKTSLTRIRDSNQGSYAGNLISINTSSLVSSNELHAPSEGIFEIPFTAKVTKVESMTKGNFLLAMKHGFYSKVAGLSAKLDNQALCTFCNLSNLYTHFNILSTMNPSDMDTVGNLIGFYKDSTAGYSYQTAASAFGVGECNSGSADPALNGIPHTDQTYFQAGSNRGFIERAKQLSYREDDPVLSDFVKTGRAAEIFKSHMTYDAAADEITYNVCAVIRLSDLHDCFKTMPITRNLNLNITVQFHSCNATIATGVDMYGVDPVLNPVNGFCPYQIKANPGGTITDNTTFNITESMGNSSRAVVELILPKITMTPEAEMDYLESMGSSHLVTYTDIHSNTETFSTPAISWQVNSALSGMTGFLMLMRLGSNGDDLNANNGAMFSCDHSPFTNAPNYLCSAQSVANLQVLLSNKPVFEAPIQYNYDIYLEMMRAKSLNGFSPNGGITSGLITRADFEEGNYGYIYVKLPRSSNMHSDQSLQVRFMNDNISKIVRLDLLAFIEVEKSYEIDVNTGKIKMIQQ